MKTRITTFLTSFHGMHFMVKELTSSTEFFLTDDRGHERDITDIINNLIKDSANVSRANS